MEENQGKYPRLQAVEEDQPEWEQSGEEGLPLPEGMQKQLQQKENQIMQEQRPEESVRPRNSYEKEATAAYTDYQKQVNPYGVQAEAMADRGLTESGYSESLRDSMYKDYQSRVAAAREGYEQALREYETALREAKQLNSSALAQIALDTLSAQTERSKQLLRQKSEDI